VKSKKILWLLSLVVVGVVIYIGTIKFREFWEKGLESGPKLMLQGVFTARKAYFDEYKEYQKDGVLGFEFGEESEYKYYLDEKSVPPKFSKLIPENAMPFVGANLYRVLLEAKEDDGSLRWLWVLNSDGKMYRIVNKELVFKADVGKK